MNELSTLFGQMSLGVIVTLAVAVALLLVIAYVAGRSHAGARAARDATARQALKAARSEIDRLNSTLSQQQQDFESQAKQLEAEISGLRNQRYISMFEDGSTWTLLASIRLDVDGQQHWLGVVKSSRGEHTPFWTTQSTDELTAGKRFAVLSNRLVQLQKSLPPETDGEADTTMMPSGDVGSTMFVKVPLEDTLDVKADVKTLPFLHVTTGDDKDRRFPVDFEGNTSMGRGDSNTIVLQDSSASRIHANIYFDGRSFLIKDNQSTNKTYHKGKPITQSMLELGDTITIGSTEMIFTCEGTELTDENNPAAIDAYEKTLKRAPEFVSALRNLAFLLERDVARKGRAQDIWDRLARIEGSKQ